MEPSYFYVLDGNVEGPEPPGKLADLYAKHLIDDNCWVFLKGSSAWVPYKSLLTDGDTPPVAPLPSIPLEIPGYWKNDSPWAIPGRIGLYLLLLGLGGGLVYASLRSDWDGLSGLAAHWVELGQAVFGVYALTLISLWTVYFRSTADGLAALPSLRRLLRAYSVQWAGQQESGGDIRGTEKRYDPQLARALQEKARVTLTSMAMLAAAAGVELAQANAVLTSKLPLDDFRMLVLGAGSLSAFTSLVCFLIATDTLDSMFNSFALPRLKQRLLRYFYLESLNPRYFGLVSLMFGAVCLIAVHEALFAAAAAGLIIAVGYRHWFPPKQLGSNEPYFGVGRQLATRGFFARVVGGVCVPLWLLAYGHFHHFLLPC